MERAIRDLSPKVLQLPVALRSITTARHELAAYLDAAGRRSPEAELAITEAVSNAVAHAFRDREPGSILLRFEILIPETLAVTVADDGRGMSPDLDYEGLGLGLSLIGGAAAEVEVRENPPHGTAVVMRFRLPSQRAA